MGKAPSFFQESLEDRKIGWICVQALGSWLWECLGGQSGTLVPFQRWIIWKHLPLPSSQFLPIWEVGMENLSCLGLGLHVSTSLPPFPGPWSLAFIQVSESVLLLFSIKCLRREERIKHSSPILRNNKINLPRKSYFQAYFLRSSSTGMKIK